MTTKTTISISEARKNIFDIVKKVQAPSTYYTFTENGKPKAILMSAEEFESLQETIEVLQDIPNLRAIIKKSEKERRKGDYMSLDDYLIKRGYAIQTHPAKRRAKRSR